MDVVAIFGQRGHLFNTHLRLAVISGKFWREWVGQINDLVDADVHRSEQILSGRNRRGHKRRGSGSRCCATHLSNFAGSTWIR